MQYAIQIQRARTQSVMGLPGFEPGSREPKSPSLDQASRQPLLRSLNHFQPINDFAVDEDLEQRSTRWLKYQWADEMMGVRHCFFNAFSQDRSWAESSSSESVGLRLSYRPQAVLNVTFQILGKSALDYHLEARLNPNELGTPLFSSWFRISIWLSGT